MAQWLKYLHYKVENLSSDPQKHAQMLDGPGDSLMTLALKDRIGGSSKHAG